MTGNLSVKQHREHHRVAVQGGVPRALQPALRPFAAAQLEALASDPRFGWVMSPAPGCALAGL